MTGLMTGARLLLHRWIFCTLLICLMACRSQEQDCHVFAPSQYIYSSDAIQDYGSSSCSTEMLSGETYFTCTEPVRIGDTNTGPQTFNPSDSSHYYRWNRTGGKMLFVFPTEAQLISVILHFYVDNGNSIARPKMTLVAVDNSFQINDTMPTDRTGTAIDRIELTGQSDGLYNETILITNRPTTSKVLLTMFSSKYDFAITEMTFCAAESVLVTTTTSEPISTAPTNKGTVTKATSSTTPSTVKDEVTDNKGGAQNILNNTSGNKHIQSSLLLMLLFPSLVLILR